MLLQKCHHRKIYISCGRRNAFLKNVCLQELYPVNKCVPTRKVNLQEMCPSEKCIPPKKCIRQIRVFIREIYPLQEMCPFKKCAPSRNVSLKKNYLSKKCVLRKNVFMKKIYSSKKARNASFQEVYHFQNTHPSKTCIPPRNVSHSSS